MTGVQTCALPIYQDAFTESKLGQRASHSNRQFDLALTLEFVAASNLPACLADQPDSRLPAIDGGFDPSRQGLGSFARQGRNRQIYCKRA